MTEARGAAADVGVKDERVGDSIEWDAVEDWVASAGVGVEASCSIW